MNKIISPSNAGKSYISLDPPVCLKNELSDEKVNTETNLLVYKD